MQGDTPGLPATKGCAPDALPAPGDPVLAGDRQGGPGNGGTSYPAPVDPPAEGGPGPGRFTFQFLPHVVSRPAGQTDPTCFYLTQPPLPDGREPVGLSFTVTRAGLTLKVHASTLDGCYATATTLALAPAHAGCRTVVIQAPDGGQHIFAVGAPICFQKGTRILTPTGYTAIEALNPGDALCTVKGAVVPLVTLVQFAETEDKCPLYCLPAGALGPDLPLRNLYMSNNHAFRAAGKWRHMKCAGAPVYPVPQPVTEYYNLVLADYFAHTVFAEGVEVETCFQEHGEVRMGWLCKSEQCVPLKCTVAH
jgi:hypothetical protein